ncbi:hypothetical protein FRB97_008218 [Tulasnella sp. 331]|nr:hypothetical protein FRB97_008218 [Tulasnella sp. 331]
MSASIKFMLAPVIIWLGFAAVISAQPTQSEALPPWQNVTIYWEWVPGLSNGAITQCQTQKLDWWQVHSPPVMTGPFTFTFYRESYEPYVLSVGMGTASGAALYYDWTVNLPTGGPYQASLTDSKGLTGGSAPSFSVVAGSSSSGACTPVNLTNSELQLSFVGDLTQCSQTNITVTGGTPPYTFSALQGSNEPKLISYTTGYFEYILDMPTGSIVNFAVNDSTGRSAVGEQFRVGSSSDASCLTLAATLVPLSPALTSMYQGLASAFPTISPPSTSSSVPVATSSHGKSVNVAAVAGGVVGGLALLLLVVILGALWWRKKQRNARRDVDLFDPNEPVSQPVIGDLSFLPQQPLTIGAAAMAKRDLGEEAYEHARRKEDIARNTIRGDSADYSSHPLLESPPYSAASRSPVGTSSSHSPNYDNRFSRATFTSDSKSEGEQASRLSPDHDQDAYSPGSNRVSRSLPPLPPGAASPDNSLAAIQKLGMTRLPELEEADHPVQQFDVSQDDSHAPPPPDYT